MELSCSAQTRINGSNAMPADPELFTALVSASAVAALACLAGA